MTKFQGICGWIFQLGGVLHDGTAWRRWLLDHLKKRGLHTHYRLFFRHWDIEYIPRVRRGELSFQDAIENMLAGAGIPAAHIHEITPALRSQRRSLLAEERPLAGVAELLHGLQAAGHRLGTSNHVIKRRFTIRSFDLGSMTILILSHKPTMPDTATSRTVYSLRPSKHCGLHTRKLHLSATPRNTSVWPGWWGCRPSASERKIRSRPTGTSRVWSSCRACCPRGSTGWPVDQENLPCRPPRGLL